MSPAGWTGQLDPVGPSEARQEEIGSDSGMYQRTHVGQSWESRQSGPLGCAPSRIRSDGETERAGLLAATLPLDALQSLSELPFRWGLKAITGDRHEWRGEAGGRGLPRSGPTGEE